MGMRNIPEQILLPGGAIGSMAGSIVTIVTYLQNKKKRKSRPLSLPQAARAVIS